MPAGFRRESQAVVIVGVEVYLEVSFMSQEIVPELSPGQGDPYGRTDGETAREAL